MAGLSIGKFQILGTLGTGAHSSILLIHRSQDSKQYALKVVDIAGEEEEKFLEQARHEFRVAQMLYHPSLIKIYALETKRDWLFRIRKVSLLIEYVNGKTLDTIPGLSIPRLVQVFAKIAAGLAHMHRRGVFHGDLKPSNVMLSRSGELKIIDYGLAWIKGQDKGRVQGTPEYMAPETSRQGVVNEKTDIYNLGATMYRLVTFRLPPSTVVASGSRSLDAQQFESQLRPAVEYNPQTPHRLNELIHQCLAFDPARRPERVSDIHKMLERMVEKMVRTPKDTLEAMEW